MCLFFIFSLKIKKLYNHRNVAKQFNKLKIWINFETTSEGLKNSSHAEFISASIYKEIPKQVRNDEKPNSHAELVSASLLY